MNPGFEGETGEAEVIAPYVDTTLIHYPSGRVFFTAFCNIAQGVRLQMIASRGVVIGTFGVDEDEL